jgi:serine/threonine protein kinase
MGRGEDFNTVYIVDFGISKYYRDSKGKHIPEKDKKSFIGTTRYASISAHLGIELSRKDDLECLG